MQAIRIALGAVAFAALTCASAPAQEVPALDGLRLNQIQVIGTHNSYKMLPPPAVIEQLRNRRPDVADSLMYEHPPLNIQLDRGVRSFELDVYYYPGEEQQLRVLHVPLVDMRTTVETWKEALEVVKGWSDAHPGHVPISILVEAKDDAYEELPVEVHSFTQEAFELMDAEIREVFPEDQLFTPDDLRGDRSSLPEAIETDGWPLLDDLRGQVFICLHEQGRLANVYAGPSPVLEGRPMFLRGEAGKPWSAVFVMDDPRKPEVTEFAEKGFLIRTRADANLEEARLKAPLHTERRDVSLASGAHIISTDFPPGAAHEETGYMVAFPGGAAARRNPVTAP